MKFNVNQQDLQQALNYCQGVIEKRSTLPILSNILLDAQNSKLTITATDLDLIFINQINNVEVIEEGKTTTTSSTMYDIVRKLSSGKKINLTLTDNSKLHLESEKSIFNLNCMPASEFPLTDENNYLNFLDKDINSINEQPTVSIDKEPPAEHYTESPPKEDIEKTQDKKVDELLETSEVTDDSATIDQVVTENFKEALETFSEKDDDTIELDSLDLGDLLDTNKKE
jgi:hypothetical protein